MSRLPFRRLVHADWSSRPAGRWVARAEREGDRWRVEAPAPVGALAGFVEGLFAPGAAAPVMAGFDLPIGLPVSYAERTGLPDFRSALEAFGAGAWDRFYDVAATPVEVTLHRPFYPARPGRRGEALHAHLTNGLGATGIDGLRRRCERGGPGERTASPLFWCLGPSAVGKAAINGWREVIVPALARGAALWPFDGELDPSMLPPATLAETYPADVYRRLGLRMAGRSKTRQDDRRSFAPALRNWADARSVELSPTLLMTIEAGFGPDRGGDDGFDALVGLLGMIAVVTGEWSAGAPRTEAVRRWEGWILGRQA